jgi:hypothetical protein
MAKSALYDLRSHETHMLMRGEEAIDSSVPRIANLVAMT